MTKAQAYMKKWQADWNCFARDVLHARLDDEQQAILHAFQHEPMVAVASGTARGKDFVAAVAALCFLYLTPRYNKSGELVSNTKVFMTAPSGRQVMQIMMPEVSRLFRKAGILPGRELSDGIRTNYREWFLAGFKADDSNMEAWSGLHADNIAFIVTEASGMSEIVFNAIEGNLQGNSRLLLVFNPNETTGYAARAMTSSRFKSFRLNSLNAENVKRKEQVIPGQVNYEWVYDKVHTWCTPVNETDFNIGYGDFEFEGMKYRPNDLFRVKVLGMFPRVTEDVLIPYEHIEIANNRWKEMQEEGFIPVKKLTLGADIAGMGRDNSVLCSRYGNFISGFDVHQSAGHADHMHVAGMIKDKIIDRKAAAYIDTIGEGAGVYSRLDEINQTLPFHRKMEIYSCKFSESARGLSDITGQYEFANMRAYLYWCIRDWLDPKNGYYAAMPPCEQLAEELMNTKWKFQSDGRIIIESKDEVKKRIKRSPDYMDAMANTFYPKEENYISDDDILKNML